MQRALFTSVFFSFMQLAGLPPAHATAHTMAVATPRATKDTIVVRLPNRAQLTLVVRDAAQLRQLKNYHLDSLTTRLASYIARAETAAKNATTDQVTVQYYPDKDQPGQNLPEQIRITTRKKPANDSRVDVVLNKAFGVVVTTDDDGSKSYGTAEGKSKADRQARRDSARLKHLESGKHSAYVVLDLGLNALVNQKAPIGTPGTPPRSVDLRPEGSRYVNIGLNYAVRLGGRRSPVSILAGPELAFNNYMLNGNDKWVNQDGRTSVVANTDGRQLQKTKLATSSINLPLLLQLKLRDSHHKPTLSLAAGGFVGYRTGAHTKLKYTIDGNTFKDKDYGSYHLEDFQYGLQGLLGYRSLQFFAKYNLNPLFKAGQGPELQTFSFGLRILGAKS